VISFQRESKEFLLVIMNLVIMGTVVSPKAEKKEFHELAETIEVRDSRIMVPIRQKLKITVFVCCHKSEQNTFTRPSAETMKKLYCCYVRPHLQFAVPVWSPANKSDINLLECVQKRATRVHRTKGMRNEERLDVFGLQKLEKRREREVLIRIIKKIDIVFELKAYQS
jgi:hypothetical protein